jgi:competence protein ComFC
MKALHSGLRWVCNNLMQLNIQPLTGHWTEGFALDLHTISSTPIHEVKTVKIVVDGKETQMQVHGDITGWDTKYTEIGEHLNKLKYWREKSRVKTIATEAAAFLSSKLAWKIDLIIPIPPSDTSRDFQPVYEIAKAIGLLNKLHVDFDTLKKLKSTSQLKTIEEPAKRREILKDAFDITSDILKGKNVLLFDDLFRSGESLNTVHDVIKNKGNAANVYVLTITKTRSKR